MTGCQTLALARSLPAPIGYYRALVRPLRTFAAREIRVIPEAGPFLFQEAPREVAARVAAWLA